ncbi:MAG TPA: RnfABCDGE type electron transport complex subunit B [Steroidobacteraceae bacterium]
MSAALTVKAEAIDALLPQTQCERCGYPGCLPYASAIAAGEAPINQCPPGGAALIRQLAQLLDQPVLPLNPANGREAPQTVAWIDPEVCIGCARCLPPCPVDAIVGAKRLLHTVLADWCTGCELCLPACPVDCIHMLTATTAGPAPDKNRSRYLAHLRRHEQVSEQRAAQLAQLKRQAGTRGGEER